MRKTRVAGADTRRGPAWLFLLLMLVPGLSADAGGDADGVVHVVLLWLKDGGNPQQRAHLVEQSGRLRGLPGVVDLRTGEVVTSERTIVDDSFDVGIYFYFDSAEAMNRYLVHPLHRQIVKEEIAPLVSRIQVYDFTHSVAEPER